jgi:hypothetical protein
VKRPHGRIGVVKKNAQINFKNKNLENLIYEV